MKVATILPQNYLGKIKYDNYHMCLAHLIDTVGYEEYTNFYMSEIREESILRKEPAYLIMDNGLIEGNPRPFHEILNKAIYIGADEFILPDVYMDGPATSKAVMDAMRYLSHMDSPKTMAVPQGKNMEEWLACAKFLCDAPVDCIGIPKHLVSTCGRDGRLEAIYQLAQTGNLEGKEIHLLGCWKSPLEVLMIAKAEQCNQIPAIRGVDSAIAYVYARAGLRFSDDDRPDSNAIDFNHGTCDETMLTMNILAWQDSGDVSKDKKTWFL
jgi:hypothetical protein